MQKYITIYIGMGLFNKKGIRKESIASLEWNFQLFFGFLFAAMAACVVYIVMQLFSNGAITFLFGAFELIAIMLFLFGFIGALKRLEPKKERENEAKD